MSDTQPTLSQSSSASSATSSRAGSLHEVSPARASDQFERFVIVNPPNRKDLVQVQLLSNRNDASEASTLQPDIQSGAAPGLQRTASNRSNRSSVHSTLSSSVASGLTSASTQRKRTAPLYNLEFHRMSPTVVTDAGTDEKIAKFMKKGGLELLQFVAIEPVAIIDARRGRQRPVSISSPSSTVPPDTTDRDIVTRTTHTDAPKSADDGGLAASSESQTNRHQGIETTDKSQRDLFSKLKRFSFKPGAINMGSLNSMLSSDILRGKSAAATSQDSSSLTVSSSGTTQPATPAVSFFDSPKLSLFKSRDREAAANSGSAPSPLFPDVPNQLVRTRVEGYVWRIKKWLRQDLEGKELVFRDFGVQWRKQPRKISHSAQRRAASPGGSADRRGEMLAPPVSQRPTKSLDIQRPNTSSTVRPDSMLESEEESDPEDSERPWICDLILPTLPISASARTLRRIRLGTLRPAPHHPRLIGQLNVPLTLSPISLGVAVTITADDGIEREAIAHISAEEMKDLLCVTALWLVVNEGLGGVQNPRKGASFLFG